MIVQTAVIKRGRSEYIVENPMGMYGIHKQATHIEWFVGGLNV